LPEISHRIKPSAIDVKKTKNLDVGSDADIFEETRGNQEMLEKNALIRALLERYFTSIPFVHITPSPDLKISERLQLL